MKNLNSVENLRFYIEKLEEAKMDLHVRETDFQEAANDFNVEELNELSYEEVRDLVKYIHRYVKSKESQNRMCAIRDKKKVEKYPELLLPHFYLEINELNISMEDKMRLDKILRKNQGYFVSKTTFKKIGFQSFEELDLLKSIGLVEKYYEVRCPDCWERINLISEKELDLYKRVWELQSNNINDLSDEAIEELDDLAKRGYLDFYNYCDVCDSEWNIHNKEEFETKISDMSIIYKIVKMPDLWSEKI